MSYCGDDGDLLTLSLRGEPVLEGRYKLERRLGQGGMGVVYKAQHIFLKSTHAIKVILPDLVGYDPMLVTRFRQEAIVAASIRHKNIVAVTDFGVANGTMPFLVMELIKGSSLEDILAEKGHLSLKFSLEIMEAIAAGVGTAHRQGIIHRDLKPLNIMVYGDLPVSEAVKVLDFGLAKIKTGDTFASLVQAKTAGFLGSPLYMAPEQWSEEEADKRTDIYSLGIILYQMLAGVTPFIGTSIPAVMKKHLVEDPAPFALHGVQVPPLIESAVFHALKKRPADRPQSVEEFIEELCDAASKATDFQLACTIHDLSLDEPLASQAQTSAETQNEVEEEVERLARALEDAQQRAEEARQRVEEAAHRRAEEEAARKLAEEEAARKLAEEEAARRRAEEEALERAQEEVARQRAAEEAQRQRAAEEAQRRAEVEVASKLVKEELARVAQEVEEARLRAEKARDLAEQEAQLRVKEEAARKLAEEKAERLARELEDAQRRAEEARHLAEEETRKHAEEEHARRRDEEAAAQKLATEAAHRRVAEEAARKFAEEEANRLAREVAEAQQRAAEARERAEEETRKRAEEETARRRAEEEAIRLAREVAEAQSRAEEVRRLAEEQARKQWEKETQGGYEEGAMLYAEGENPTRRLESRFQERTEGLPERSIAKPLLTTASQPKTRTFISRRLSLLGVVTALVIAVGGYGIYRKLSVQTTPTTGKGQLDIKPTPPVQSPAPTRADMVSIPGGTFRMGRDDVFLKDKANYEQGPAHPVTVESFFIDRTEVTNAEYAQFVSETKYKPPKGWSENSPLPGREQWPVTNVSLDDAQAFARWRSQRDGITYRLPTEEEWEYAARGGSKNYLYPWGNKWFEDRANLGTGGDKEVVFPKAVGSYPQGATVWNVQDMIGNVHEWTSSEATYYHGSKYSVPDNERGQIVIRGGSHQSLLREVVDQRHGREFPATWRAWVKRSETDDTLGFRLVRDGQ